MTAIPRSEVEEIRRLALEGHDDYTIRLRTGRCKAVVERERRNAGVRHKASDLDREEQDRIINLLHAGESTREVSLAAGRSKPAIRSMAWRAGIKLPGKAKGGFRLRRPRMTVEIDPGTRKRLLDAEHGLKAGSAVETIRRLLDMGGF